MLTTETSLYDFSSRYNKGDWVIVNDDVMGGRSTSQFLVNDDGHAVFKGNVSLENNGGFASVRYRPEPVQLQSYVLHIRLKGDGKKYQFRIKSKRWDRHTYVFNFKTTGEWETISIPLKNMYPSFRGMTLDMPNYCAEQIAEMGFLIANYKAESFRLEIDRLYFK